MPSCCVVDCRRRGGGSGMPKMYRIPVGPPGRREKWIAALRRGVAWDPNPNSRVCDCHFLTGTPVNDPGHVDYAPWIFPWTSRDRVDKGQARLGEYNKLVCEIVTPASGSHNQPASLITLIAEKRKTIVEAEHQTEGPDCEGRSQLIARYAEQGEACCSKMQSSQMHVMQQQQRKRLLPESSDAMLSKRVKAAATAAATAAAAAVTTAAAGSGAADAAAAAAPMDLSRKKAAVPAVAGVSAAAATTSLAASSTEEIITVSDDEEKEIQLLAAKQADPALASDPEAAAALLKDQGAVLRRLRECLRSEECKLAMLKAMRHSQRSATGTTSAAAAAAAAASTQQQTLAKDAAAARPSATAAAAAGTQSAVSRAGQLPTAQQSKAPSAAAGATGSAHHHQQPMMSLTRGQPSSAVPAAMKAAAPASAAAAPKPAPAPPPQPPPPPQPQISQAQLDAQKAQKKLALRKQLEKSLLEIPNPQPPPSELNFIPSTVTNEFIALVGLEEVVRNISEYDAMAKGGKPTEVKYVFHPFTCVQCGTDYTPVWKRDKPGSKNVICEQCVSVNQKNAIRKDHTARLKAAFVKALKQEEEIEKEFKRYATNPQLAAQAFPHLLPPPPPQQQPQQPQVQQQSHQQVGSSSQLHHHHHQSHHHHSLSQHQQQQQQHHASLGGMPSLSSHHPRSSSSLQSLGSSSSVSSQRMASAVSSSQQAAVAAAASQAAAAAAVEQLQRQHTQFLQAQLQAMSQLYPAAAAAAAAGQAGASSYPYTMPTSYLSMLQQAMRQGISFNPAALWSTINASQQSSQQQPGKK